MNICIIDQCNNKITCIKKYCAKHYIRFKRYGDPNIIKKAPNGSGYINKKNGYRYIFINKRKIGEHQHVMEQFIGRRLEKGEIVHHKNKNRLDNRIENLEVMKIGDHLEMHNTKHPEKENYKICSKCLIKRHINNFPKHKYTRSGYRSECRYCKNIRQKKRYHIVKFIRPKTYKLNLSRLNKLP